jgi:Mrp family chromosome partitioning ATPase
MATPSKSARASRPAQDRPGTALATIVDTDDEGTVIPLHVGTDWTMNPELLKLDAASDLAKLRDALCVAATEGCFVVGITSMPEASHLKSRLAAQLAWLLSQTEHARVLLLEVDFAHPNVADVMQLDMPPLSGFSQQLQAHIQEGQAPWVVMRCTSSLCVLAEGRVRTPGVIYTNEFTVALAQLRRNFDLIVADGPAIGVHVDTRAFDDVADGIVFVTSTSTPVEQALSTASQWFRSRRLMAAATVRERQAS